MKSILGKSFYLKNENLSETFISSIPRFTYHKHFSPLTNGMTTDKNWGCCIRSGQGILAQYFLNFSEKYPNLFKLKFPHVKNSYLELFYDLEDSPFGIQNICKEILNFGGKPGEWVKASIFAQVIKNIFDKFKLNCYLVNNGIIIKEEIIKILENKEPMLFLSPLMFGIKEFDLNYLMYLKFLLSIIHRSIGIIAGQNARAYFFVGYIKDELYYFDPHILLDSIIDEKSENILYQPKLLIMNPNQLNSSVLIALYIEQFSEIEQLILPTDTQILCPFTIINKIETIDQTQLDEWNIIY